jgi:lipopolysaccharide transport system permease protein
MSRVILSGMQAVYSYRSLLYQLIMRDLVTRYRQSMLGYVWAIVPQLLTVLVFYMLAQHRMINIGQTEMPYILHALWGVSVWQYFSACLVNATSALSRAENLVKKVNFPREVLVFACIGQPLVDFIIRLFPFLLLCYVSDFVPAWQSIFIVIPMLFLTLLVFAVGLVGSIVNLVVRDVSNALSMLLMIGMFLAPILYPEPVTYPASLLNWLNPFSPYLIASRDLLLGRPLHNLDVVLWTGLLTTGAFLTSWFVFRATIQCIAEKA